MTYFVQELAIWGELSGGGSSLLHVVTSRAATGAGGISFQVAHSPGWLSAGAQPGLSSLRAPQASSEHGGWVLRTIIHTCTDIQFAPCIRAPKRSCIRLHYLASEVTQCHVSKVTNLPGSEGEDIDPIFRKEACQSCIAGNACGTGDTVTILENKIPSTSLYVLLLILALRFQLQHLSQESL